MMMIIINISHIGGAVCLSAWERERGQGKCCPRSPCCWSASWLGWNAADGRKTSSWREHGNSRLPPIVWPDAPKAKRQSGFCAATVFEFSCAQDTQISTLTWVPITYNHSQHWGWLSSSHFCCRPVYPLSHLIPPKPGRLFSYSAKQSTQSCGRCDHLEPL